MGISSFNVCRFGKSLRDFQNTTKKTYNNFMKTDSEHQPGNLSSSEADQKSNITTCTQDCLAAIWQETLGVCPTHAGDDFFALGGNSVLATMALSRIRQQFQVELTFQAFFDHSTLAAMAAEIEQSAPPALALSLLSAAARDGALPLSHSQERLWFQHQLDPQGSAYNITYAWRFQGALHAGALQRSLDRLVSRHESLRTTFPSIHGRPVQKIAPELELKIQAVDFRLFPAAERDEAVQKHLVEHAARPFEIEAGPLFRMQLLLTGEQEFILFFVLHHLITDAWSEMILTRELMALYAGEAAGRRVELPPLKFQYADYAAWQRQWLDEAAIQELLAYWRPQLAGLTPLNLPGDHPRPPVQTFNGAILSIPLDPELLQGLKDCAEREGLTPYMVSLAAFLLLLNRYTGQTDIAAGSFVMNRERFESEPLVGSLVNTLVMRSDLTGSPSLREYFKRVRAMALGAFAHQEMPFARLVAELNPEREPSTPPLVNVVFNMLNLPMPSICLDGMLVQYLDVERRGAQFDLSFSISDWPNYHQLIGEYNTNLFDRATIERMLRHYQNLLRAMLSDPEQAIDAIPILDETECQLLLKTWNDTEMPLPAVPDLVELIRAQAARTPDARAVSASDGTLSYAGLMSRVDALTGALLARGIRPGERVGLGLERTSDMVVAPLAVLAAGAVYVPLDPTFPDQRLAWMMENSGLTLILTHTSVAKRWPETIPQLILDPAIYERGVEDPVAHLQDANRLAYILYTSGSTGKPKGVAVYQRALVNFLWAISRQVGMRREDVLLEITTLSFDIAGMELYLPLINGASLVIATQLEIRDGYLLKELLMRHAVTMLQATPVTWQMLLATGWEGKPDLRAVSAGEALSSDLARKLLPRVSELWNMYGPTETTVQSAILRVTEEVLGTGIVPIGRPIGNTQIYVLDSRLEPVPVGVAGELFIGGSGVAQGYWDNPELTAQRFLPDPFSGAPGARMYRTGDEVRWGADGILQFIGRKDFQVKVRGYRIELGEIEAVLNQHDRIKQAVVIARVPSDGLARLAAYYVAAGEGQAHIPAEELAGFARKQLPDYMIPTTFIELEKFPQTPSGKVDRKALPEPDFSGSTAHANALPPHTDVEKSLAQIWTALLGIRQAGLQDNFFSSGGHSLLAVQLFAEIETRFGVRLPLSILFQTPTLSELALAIQQRGAHTIHSPLVPIQPNGSRPPFYCVHPIGGGVMGYEPLARHLGDDQPIYGLESRPEDAGLPATEHIETIAARYLQAVRDLQPDGPYYLGGYSYGGTVAYEMARQLREQGQSVNLLAIFDSPAPKSGYEQPKLNFTFINGLLHNLWHWGRDFLAVSPRERKGRIRRKLFAHNPNPQEGEIDLRDYIDDISLIPDEYRELMRKHFRAYELYHPQPYEGHVTVFRSPRQPLFCSYDPHLEWDHLAKGGVSIYSVLGSHRNLLAEPHVQQLAAALQAALAKSL
jgi:amino acid adenylation domain-containing protein